MYVKSNPFCYYGHSDMTMHKFLHWLVYIPARPLRGEQTRLHWFKWRLIRLFGLYEFKVTCGCGTKIHATDGVRDYEYECIGCSTVYTGTKRVFS